MCLCRHVHQNQRSHSAGLCTMVSNELNPAYCFVDSQKGMGVHVTMLDILETTLSKLDERARNAIQAARPWKHQRIGKSNRKCHLASTWSSWTLSQKDSPAPPRKASDTTAEPVHLPGKHIEALPVPDEMPPAHSTWPALPPLGSSKSQEWVSAWHDAKLLEPDCRCNSQAWRCQCRRSRKQNCQVKSNTASARARLPSPHGCQAMQRKDPRGEKRRHVWELSLLGP